MDYEIYMFIAPLSNDTIEKFSRDYHTNNHMQILNILKAVLISRIKELNKPVYMNEIGEIYMCRDMEVLRDVKNKYVNNI